MNKCDNKYTTQFHFTFSKNMHISSIPSDNTDTCGGDYRGSRGGRCYTVRCQSDFLLQYYSSASGQINPTAHK